MGVRGCICRSRADAAPMSTLFQTLRSRLAIHGRLIFSKAPNRNIHNSHTFSRRVPEFFCLRGIDPTPTVLGWSCSLNLEQEMGSRLVLTH
jgi:hypothetical protein